MPKNGTLNMVPYNEDAHAFVQQYAQSHEFFASEEVCDAYKAAGLPVPPDKGWRDRWGSVMSRAAKANIVKKVGKAAPKSGSTHMTSTVQWMSLTYKGERTLIQTGSDRIEELRKAWITRGITDMRDLLWRAYEFGFDQGAQGKEKLKQ